MRPLILTALTILLAACGGSSTAPDTPPPPVGPAPASEYVGELLSTQSEPKHLAVVPGEGVYALCEDRVILRRTGAEWAAMTRPDPPNAFGTGEIEGVSVSADGVLFAVGDDFVMRRQDGQWFAEDVGSEDVNADDIWAASADRAFAVGFRGGVYRWDGLTWIQETSETTEWLHAVHGSSFAVVAVGRNGAVLVRTGSSWQLLDSPTTATLNGVWMTSFNDGWIWGNSNTLLQMVDGQISAVDVPALTGVRKMWGTSPNSIYAVVADGVVRFNGSAWEPIHTFEDLRPFDIHGTAGNDIYVAGRDSGGGAIWHFDGNAWSQEYFSQYRGLVPLVWASPTDVCWVAGRGPRIVQRYEGDTYLEFDLSGLTDQFLDTLAGVSDTSIWASSGEKILHYDGGTWSVVANLPAGTTLNDLHMLSDQEGFGVGQNGTIVQLNGASWSAMPSPTAANLFAVHASHSDNVYAIGDQGLVLRYDGASWFDITVNADPNLREVWAFDRDDVILRGHVGQIQHFDGRFWSALGVAANRSLFGLGATSSNAVFAGSYEGQLLLFDGDAWEPLPDALTTQRIHAVATSNARTLWAVTHAGDVLRYRAP